MSRWNALYETPTLFSPEWGQHRIFAPTAYPSVRNVTTVGIAHPEALVLARYFPLCWQRFEDKLRLVALVSLREGYARLPGYDDLPLALRAFPVVVQEALGERLESLWVDKTIADTPKDIGAPILLDDGKLSEAARRRIRYAVDLSRAIPATDELTRDLETHGLLEPWPLKFDLGDAGKVNRTDLAVFSASQLQNPALYKLIERHGVQAGLFIGVHRASLFRINWLIQALRQAPAPAAKEPDDIEVRL
ncbi:MAG: SapC family protein [Proteobacteria bacterium]|nr:SapC family protein [Pseudomonadota bacterium]